MSDTQTTLEYHEADSEIDVPDMDLVLPSYQETREIAKASLDSGKGIDATAAMLTLTAQYAAEDGYGSTYMATHIPKDPCLALEFLSRDEPIMVMEGVWQDTKEGLGRFIKERFFTSRSRQEDAANVLRESREWIAHVDKVEPFVFDHRRIFQFMVKGGRISEHIFHDVEDDFATLDLIEEHGIAPIAGVFDKIESLLKGAKTEAALATATEKVRSMANPVLTLEKVLGTNGKPLLGNYSVSISRSNLQSWFSRLGKKESPSNFRVTGKVKLGFKKGHDSANVSKLWGRTSFLIAGATAVATIGLGPIGAAVAGMSASYLAKLGLAGKDVSSALSVKSAVAMVDLALERGKKGALVAGSKYLGTPNLGERYEKIVAEIPESRKDASKELLQILESLVRFQASAITAYGSHSEYLIECIGVLAEELAKKAKDATPNNLPK